MKVIVTMPTCVNQHRIKRVAAYIRVSTKKEAQLHSLESQIDYFERALDQNPDYDFVGIYADHGISGATEDRLEFQRLLADCRAGKIDAVITKSITRFARNTEVFLKSVRELSDLGIDVYFEKENIHSTGRSELELSLRAQFAEEEIRSMSQNQKMKIRARFADGIAHSGRMIGYRYANGSFTQVADEVDVVKLIFESYLSGMGVTAIAKLLNEKGFRTIKGTPWNGTTVAKVLRNEKYAGRMLLQKTYRKGHLSKWGKRNTGELRMFEVEDSHEPIISKEMFDAVQKEIEKRANIHAETMEKVPAEKHLFTGYLFCGHCGCKYGYHDNGNRKDPAKKPKWLCVKSKNRGQDYCPAKYVPEEVLISRTKDVLEKANLIKPDVRFCPEQIPEYLEKYMDRIIVSGDRELTFILKDNEVHIVQWEYTSRSKSWTPEMKQKAREKRLAVLAEKRKGEK